MICTEEEAQGKWCPQIRTNGTDALSTGVAINMVAEAAMAGGGGAAATPTLTGVGNCQASNCMMWMWETSDNQYLEDEAAVACARLNDPDFRGMVKKIQDGVIVPNARRGFCGLTGRRGL